MATTKRKPPAPPKLASADDLMQQSSDRASHQQADDDEGNENDLVAQLREHISNAREELDAADELLESLEPQED